MDNNNNNNNNNNNIDFVNDLKCNNNVEKAWTGLLAIESHCCKVKDQFGKVMKTHKNELERNQFEDS